MSRLSQTVSAKHCATARPTCCKQRRALSMINLQRSNLRHWRRPTCRRERAGKSAKFRDASTVRIFGDMPKFPFYRNVGKADGNFWVENQLHLFSRLYTIPRLLVTDRHRVTACLCTLLHCILYASRGNNEDNSRAKRNLYDF